MILPDNWETGLKSAGFRKRKAGANSDHSSSHLPANRYFKRYDRIDAELGKMEEALIRDLRIDQQACSAINAGLVINTAFARIVENYQFFNVEDRQQRLNSAGNRRRYLYEELTEIEKRITQSILL
jgi:hypothetical protein